MHTTTLIGFSIRLLELEGELGISGIRICPHEHGQLETFLYYYEHTITPNFNLFRTFL